MQRLLVVDDERNVLFLLKKHLSSTEVEVVTAATAQKGIEAVVEERPDAVILDVRLPDMSGLDAFNRIHELAPRLPVIIITAQGTTETAIEAMKRGAFEYMLKPLDLHELRDVVQKALELSRLSNVPAVFEQDQPTDAIAADRIVGRSGIMQKVYKDIGRVAPQDVNVLILGESGTGKELVARAIYQHSRRSDEAFLAINCAAIPEPLLESELFGHERGAYTGADRRRIGKFEQANGGTIFLDEIGDMTMATQAKILRLLQDGCFQRVGSNETVQTDVRIIAATNKDLEEAITEGEFREDLYYRLKVFTISLPPLRDRMEDLPLLAEYFAAMFGKQLSKPVSSIAGDTIDLLNKYRWPGNIRELQGSMKYAIVKMPGEVLTPECLPPSVSSPREHSTTASLTKSEKLSLSDLVRRLIRSGSRNVYREVHGTVEKAVIEQVLEEVHGNQVAASEILGISRTTLRAKLRVCDDDHS